MAQMALDLNLAPQLVLHLRLLQLVLEENLQRHNVLALQGRRGEDRVRPTHTGSRTPAGAKHELGQWCQESACTEETACTGLAYSLPQFSPQVFYSSPPSHPPKLIFDVQ